MRVTRTLVSGCRSTWAALLLAATLLFCHGIFGASHILAQEEDVFLGGGIMPTTHDARLAHAADGPGSDAGQALGHLPGYHAGVATEYFAVLLIFAGAATLWLFLRVSWCGPTRRESLRLFSSRRRNAGARHARQRPLEYGPRFDGRRTDGPADA